MDIAGLSMVMNQSKVQQDASLALMKIAMNTGKETAAQMTQMIGKCCVDPNVGQHLDTRA